jgi:hypothetical protein
MYSTQNAEKHAWTELKDRGREIEEKRVVTREWVEVLLFVDSVVAVVKGGARK